MLEEYIGKKAKVLNSQATYVNICIDGQKLRCDFYGKAKSHFHHSDDGILLIHSDHPLLYDYNFQKYSVYLNSKPSNTDEFLIKLKNAITYVIEPWRNWSDYITANNLFPLQRLSEVVSNGSGLLVDAPQPISIRVKEICDQEGVEAIICEEGSNQERGFKALTIGSSYVVASDFELSYQGFCA